MDFDAAISAGWGDHAGQPEAVAQRLPALADGIDEAAKVGKLVALASHVLGEHLDRWADARDLCDVAIGPFGDDPSTAGSWAHLGAARQLSGDHHGAVLAELQAWRLAPERRLALSTTLRLKLMSAHAARGESAKARALIDSLSAVAATAPELDKAMAMGCNNVATALLEGPRSPDGDDLMLHLAERAHYFWGRAGDWVNDERARYLLALVHNASGRPERAIEEIEVALALIADNGEENVDQAFLYLALAAAQAALGQDPVPALAHADSLAEDFKPDWLTSWYADERAKVQA